MEIPNKINYFVGLRGKEDMEILKNSDLFLYNGNSQ